MVKLTSVAFTVLIFGYKAVNITQQKYQNFYEQHITLAQSLSGPWFLNSHTRFYSLINAALAYNSTPFAWDTMAVLTFNNESRDFGFQKILSLPENAKKIHDDEARFMVPPSQQQPSPAMIIIGPNSKNTINKDFE
jgi:hypothetical protein